MVYLALRLDVERVQSNQIFICLNGKGPIKCPDFMKQGPDNLTISVHFIFPSEQSCYSICKNALNRVLIADNSMPGTCSAISKQ